ncbi:hypothetical protein DYB32_003751, partial [Aphanomyces invadans]
SGVKYVDVVGAPPHGLYESQENGDWSKTSRCLLLGMGRQRSTRYERSREPHRAPPRPLVAREDVHLEDRVRQSIHRCGEVAFRCEWTYPTVVIVVALTASGSVFAWGKNDYGQLGLGHHLQAQVSTSVQNVPACDIAITNIATRGSHVLAISEDGAVFSWGRGDEGQLGHNSRETLHLPKRITKLHHIVDVACGRAHSVALGHNGSRAIAIPRSQTILCTGALYTWGGGDDGALGLQNVESALEPMAVPTTSSSFQAIACGSRHTLALTSDFRVLSWGWNLYGQLGLGHLDTVRFPTEIPSFIGHKVVQIVCGYGSLPAFLGGLSWGPHSLCSVHPHGSFAWGRGTDGEVGTGTISTSQSKLACILHYRVVFQVACGWAHSVALVQEDATASTLATTTGMTAFKWITSGDWDAFSGMFVQTILQLMIISSLLPTQVHLPVTDLQATVLPAAVATTMLGNVFFAFQGIRLSQKDRKHDVTAMPHGINTVLVFAYALSIMEPEYQRTKSFTAAYEVGLFAAMLTGVLQMLLLPLLKFLQTAIPKAALLASVSGVALTFLSMGFAFEIWENPLVALGPLLFSFERKAHDSNHGTAVVLGMVPALAAWACQLVQNALNAVSPSTNVTTTIHSLAVAGLNPHGMIALSQGYLLTSIVLASTMVHILERDFIYAAAWMVLAAILSATGVIHAYEIVGNAITPAFGWFPTSYSQQFAIVYIGMAAMLATFHVGEEEYKYTWSHMTKMVKSWWGARKKARLPQAASAGEDTPLLLRTQSTMVEMEK